MPSLPDRSLPPSRLFSAGEGSGATLAAAALFIGVNLRARAAQMTMYSDPLRLPCVAVCSPCIAFNKNQQWLMIGESSQTIGCKDVKQAPQTLLLPASQHLL